MRDEELSFPMTASIYRTLYNKEGEKKGREMSPVPYYYRRREIGSQPAFAFAVSSYLSGQSSCGKNKFMRSGRMWCTSTWMTGHCTLWQLSVSVMPRHNGNDTISLKSATRNRLHAFLGVLRSVLPISYCLWWDYVSLFQVKNRIILLKITIGESSLT